MSYLLQHLLEASARRDPDALAVLDGERTLTYGDLDLLSNRLANLLRERLGVRGGDRVALYLDKSLEAVVGIYGVLKAGAGYVPLDPQAPPARLGYVAANAGVRVLLSGAEKQASWQPLLDAGARIETVVVLNAEHGPWVSELETLGRSDVAEARAHAPDAPVTELDLAYTLYTSGSTGQPKGVMLTHRNCLGFVEWAAREFGITSTDRVSSHAPFHFDLSTFDLFAAALAGAAVVLVAPEASVFPSELRRLIEETGITVWYSVPSILAMLALRGGLEAGSLPKLRVVLFAGEVFPTPHLRRLVSQLPHVRFANLYGPTETNVCTWWEVSDLPEDESESIPIGSAINNVEVFAMREDGQPAAPGEVGELFVRGPTVMAGYLGDAEKTASRLVSNPCGGPLNQLVYRTGDLVRQDADGHYRFLGRRDAQIKSRGYRIELGDIESTLGAHPAVIECAVVAVPDDLVSNRIRAFVTTRNGGVSGAELKTFCGARIPTYMVPESFELVSELPRTSTGKIDRQTLSQLAAGPRQVGT